MRFAWDMAAVVGLLFVTLSLMSGEPDAVTRWVAVGVVACQAVDLFLGAMMRHYERKLAQADHPEATGAGR